MNSNQVMINRMNAKKRLATYNREKLSLILRLAEIARIRHEQDFFVAYTFYASKSREELRSIMRTVKGIFHLSHLTFTRQTIDQLGNWIKYFDKSNNSNLLSIGPIDIL